MKARSAHATAPLQLQLTLSQSSSVCARCSFRLTSTFPTLGQHRLSTRPSNTHARNQSSWAAAAVQKAAETFLENGRKNDPVLPGGVTIDPFRSVAKEMKGLTSNMRQLVGSGHPVLDTVSKYYTQAEGKHIRPMLVLLMSQATASLRPQIPALSNPVYSTHQPHFTNHDINMPLSPPSILSDTNPSIPRITTTTREDDSASLTADSSNINPAQRRLAEITELIHTASLLHDDVIDHSTTRRSAPSANIEFGNKMAVLAGDFLLGRASLFLARLRNPEVTELLATVIANLIEGEFMQLQNTQYDEASPKFRPGQTVEYYLQKTYLKSASLISKSCRAAALLGGCAREVADAAYGYGRNLGLAFQLVDDMLDFSVSAAELGKPAGADLELGLATAPLLFAWQSRPDLGPLVGRKFSAEGDVKMAREIVAQSDGIEQTRALAQEYADKAVECLAGFPDSDAKTALEEMCTKVMQRRR